MGDLFGHQVGEKIRRSRVRAGLSEAQLAKRVGVTKGTLRRIEQGVFLCAVSTLDRIDQALKVAK